MNPALMIPFVLIQPILAGITLLVYSVGIFHPLQILRRGQCQ